ncbi:exopolyphosphatase, partial [Salmonella enterica subsp. enterica serovar Istanbul]|nr:exopolyphosphatase [Salmonella enterica subsp. enterica serovar Istanbul]
HHASEATRVKDKPANHIIDPKAMSAARVVYDHFGGAAKLPRINEEMMREVDKADAAQFSKDEILAPKGWVLLNYLMDPRTGLGRFREFRISNYQLMMDLIDACRTMSIDEILKLPDVQE